MNRRGLIWTLVAALALAGGIWSGAALLRSGAPPAPVYQAATVLPVPRPLPGFVLTDQDGRPFGPAQLSGRWSLIFAGFTNCGHICPMTMARLRAIVDAAAAPVDVVFVSVDPGRDTPEAIKAYVQRFDPRFIGVTGQPEQLDILANTLGAPYSVVQDEGQYTVDHSTAIFVVNPDGEFAAVFTAPHDVSAIAADLDSLMASG